jgi:RNA polymerase sigma factor (sigma-70 family)
MKRSISFVAAVERLLRKLPRSIWEGGDVVSLPGARELMEEKERLQALVKAIALLPEKEREVVAMRTQGELAFREIAEIVGAPIGTVLARMHAAKKRLKILLNNELGK